jgi:hypothetical protein
MKLRTRTLGVIGAAVVTTGLVLGLSFAGSSAATGTDQTAPTTVRMPIGQMPEMGEMPAMGSMMGGDHGGMAAMMGSADMTAMHSMMHQMMEGTIDDEALAECDNAHDSMAGSMTSRSEQDQALHGAHHGSTGS